MYTYFLYGIYKGGRLGAIVWMCLTSELTKHIFDSIITETNGLQLPCN